MAARGHNGADPEQNEGEARAPFLCVVTPVFDPARDSLCKLIADLQSQSFGDFQQVMVSNGPSPAIREVVLDINRSDSRFTYDELPLEPTPRPEDLLANLGRRRDHCLKKYAAARFAFLDADVKVCDEDYFRTLHRAHHEIHRDILITLTRIHDGAKESILPIFPVRQGHIDIANFTFSNGIAKKYRYPSDFDPNAGWANDYRFFSMISNEGNTAILNFVSTIRDGNNAYKRLTELFLEDAARKEAEANGIRQKSKAHFGFWKFLR